MTDAPPPLVAPDVDLRDFTYMPLDVVRLRDSGIAARVTGEEFRCAVLLWCASWHQVPAGSLPDDDRELAQLAGYGRAVGEWQKHRANALYGFIMCTDGRLYHPVICEKARDAWDERLAYRSRQKNRVEAAKHAALSRWSSMRGASNGHADGIAVDMPTASEPDAVCTADAMPKGKGRERSSYSPPEEDDIPACPDRRQYPAQFDALWQRYPRKVGKGVALKAWRSACKRAAVEEIEAGLDRALPELGAREEKFIPHLVTWLRGDRWLDEPPAMVNGSQPSWSNGVAHSGVAAAAEVSPQIWRRRMEDFENHGSWRPEWGPRPDEAGCSAPGELLPGSVG